MPVISVQDLVSEIGNVKRLAKVGTLKKRARISLKDWHHKNTMNGPQAAQQDSNPPSLKVIAVEYLVDSFLCVPPAMRTKHTPKIQS
jgi:hypothetical protein